MGDGEEDLDLRMGFWTPEMRFWTPEDEVLDSREWGSGLWWGWSSGLRGGRTGFWTPGDGFLHSEGGGTPVGDVVSGTGLQARAKKKKVKKPIPPPEKQNVRGTGVRSPGQAGRGRPQPCHILCKTQPRKWHEGRENQNLKFNFFLWILNGYPLFFFWLI